MGLLDLVFSVVSSFADHALSDNETYNDLKDARNAYVDKAHKGINNAYKESSSYSDKELISKFKESSGAEKAGYGMALQDRFDWETE